MKKILSSILTLSLLASSSIAYAARTPIFGGGNGIIDATIIRYSDGTRSVTSDSFPIPSGLIAYYPMTNCDGSAITTTTLPDCSGNGYDGTITNSPTRSTKGITFASASSQYVTLPSAITSVPHNKFTFVIAANATNVNFGTGNFTMIGNSASAATTVFEIAATDAYYPQPNSHLTLVSNNGHVGAALQGTANGPTVYGIEVGTSTTGGSYYYNGLDNTAFSNGISGASHTGTLQIGGSSGTSHYFDGTIYAVAIYSRVLTANEQAINSAALNQLMKRRESAFVDQNQYTISYQNTATGNLVADGDSITKGVNGNNTYTSYVSASTTWTTVNAAASGYYTNDLRFKGPNQVDLLYNPFVKNLYIGWVGSNDLTGTAVGPTFEKLKNIFDARKRAGYKTIVATIVSRTGTGAGSATMDSLKNDYNALIRANWPSFADGLADIAADPRLGADGAYANPDATACNGGTCFQVDAIHPTTAAGQYVEAPIINAAINTLFATGTPSVACAATCALDLYARDTSGIVYISGVQTTVTVTFGSRKQWAPHCVVSSNATAGFYTASSTLTTLVMNTASSLGTASVSYRCEQ